jgi:hypothetical protein
VREEHDLIETRQARRSKSEGSERNVVGETNQHEKDRIGEHEARERDGRRQ